MNVPPRRSLLLLLALPALLSAAPHPQTAPGRPGTKRDFTVDAKKYAFAPARIEVAEGDVVRITLIAADIPHSFTIDDYRIAKRGEPGKPLTFEFLADRAGTFRFFCRLTIDDGCRKMTGELIVTRKH